MKKLSVTFTVPILATRPTSLRPRSSSIRCSARSLGSASSSVASASSSVGLLPRDRVPAIGRITTLPSRTRTRISGLEHDDLEAAEIEEAEIGRGIDPPQRAIERERRQVEAAGEALRQHDLERVARDDIVLRPGDHRVEFGLARVRPRFARLDQRIDGRRRVIERRLERGDDRVQPRLRALVAARAETPGAGRTGVTTPFRRARRRTRPSPSGGSAAPRARRSGRAWRAPAAPYAAPCRSRDSRTRRPTSAAGRAAGRCAIRRAALSRRRSGSPGQGTNASGSVSARRLISARSPVERQMRSGSRPIIE